jgi:hypothetical protein
VEADRVWRVRARDSKKLQATLAAPPLLRGVVQVQVPAPTLRV